MARSDRVVVVLRRIWRPPDLRQLDRSSAALDESDRRRRHQAAVGGTSNDQGCEHERLCSPVPHTPLWAATCCSLDWWTCLAPAGPTDQSLKYASGVFNRLDVYAS